MHFSLYTAPCTHSPCISRFGGRGGYDRQGYGARGSGGRGGQRVGFGAPAEDKSTAFLTKSRRALALTVTFQVSSCGSSSRLAIPESQVFPVPAHGWTIHNRNILILACNGLVVNGLAVSNNKF